MALFRLFFILDHFALTESISIIEFGKAFLTGARFDTIIVLYILAPLILLLPWVSMRSSLTRRLSLIYLASLFAICFLTLLIDSRFYTYFGAHLNFLAIEYMQTGGTTTQHLLVTEPELWLVAIVWIVLSVAFMYLSYRLYRWSTKKSGMISVWFKSLLYLILLAVTGIGIRGRLGLSPMDVGVAMVSKHEFVNQATLNGAYTLIRTVSETRDPRLTNLPEDRRFPFVEKSEALATVYQMLHQTNDDWIQPDSTIFRTRHQAPSEFGFNPNIVFILMEGLSGRNVGCLGADEDLTPHFDSAASRGVLFTDFFANGHVTSLGITSSLCSFPALPGRSLMKRYHTARPYRALSSILKERGYTNVFAYGGDIVFDNMEGFLKVHGFDQVLGDRHFGLENQFTKWGIPDHIMLQKTVEIIDSLPRPFMVSLLTLSNHEPFDLPDSSIQRYFDDSDSSRFRNAQLYADHALGGFFATIDTLAVSDSTIYVFVSDHAKFRPDSPMAGPRNFSIPLLIYSPALLSPHVIRTTSSQVGYSSNPHGHSRWRLHPRLMGT
jgi:phosphoglycerol transferase MdoB-like AlkP superfamily enzyme